ncbi:DUF2630 family protein [Paenarthrobacter sp. NPDC018779]|uniref:DUF2630 family protein n=1 Tax=Paenarthrobacter sp. NPDC018779 TaxID=3364375 RepID=UPI0037C572F7
MDNQDILERIQSLVEEEHQLRDAPNPEDGKARLAQVEAQLDQCWDLLRQRRAKRDAGENPDDAAARPVSEVEGYRQ